MSKKYLLVIILLFSLCIFGCTNRYVPIIVNNGNESSGGGNLSGVASWNVNYYTVAKSPFTVDSSSVYWGFSGGGISSIGQSVAFL